MRERLRVHSFEGSASFGASDHPYAAQEAAAQLAAFQEAEDQLA
jgi:hypothetical protein